MSDVFGCLSARALELFAEGKAASVYDIDLISDHLQNFRRCNVDYGVVTGAYRVVNARGNTVDLGVGDGR